MLYNEYAAFISYRHQSPDQDVAAQLHRLLENYHIPAAVRKATGKKRVGKVFRDHEELPLSTDLGEDIEAALQASEWLIVIASPAYLQSRWCRRELETFLALGRRDHVLVVLADGEPNESFPPELLVREGTDGPEMIEPLAADVRAKSAPERRRKVKSESLRLLAPMLAQPYDALKQRAKTRRTRITAACCAGVMALSAGFGVYALDRAKAIRKERDAAVENASGMLIEKSLRATAEGDHLRGIDWALQAYELSRGLENEPDEAISSALQYALYPAPFTQVTSVDDKGGINNQCALSADGRYLAMSDAQIRADIYSTRTGERIFRTESGYQMSFTPDSRYFVCVKDQTILLRACEDGAVAVSRDITDSGWQLIYPLPLTEARFLVANDKGEIAMLSAFGEEEPVLTDITISGAYAMCARSDGRQALIMDESHLTVLDTESGRAAMVWTAEDMGYEAGGLDQYALHVVGYQADENYFFYYDNSDKWFHYINSSTLEHQGRSDELAVIAPSGRNVLFTDGHNGAGMISAQDGSVLWTFEENYSNTVYSARFLSDDYVLLSHGQVRVMNVQTGEEVLKLDDATYGYDIGGGLLAVPLRAGGNKLFLLPGANTDDLQPAITLPTAETIALQEAPGEMRSITERKTTAGNWQGIQYGSFIEEIVVGEEEGLYYMYEGQSWRICPTLSQRTSPYLYVSQDNRYQVLLYTDNSCEVFRATESPEPYLQIPGFYNRLSAAIWGDTLALGAYAENVSFYDLKTGDLIGTAPTGCMITHMDFSPDGSRLIALCAQQMRVDIVSTADRTVIAQLPMNVYYDQVDRVGFDETGNTAVVRMNDGSTLTAQLTGSLDELVMQAQKCLE